MLNSLQQLSYLHFVKVHAKVDTLRPVNPHSSKGGHSVTFHLLLPSFMYISYHCRNVGLGLRRSKRNIHYQTVWVNSWGMAVLLHSPSCSTNPRGATATVYFYYLSSRRQATLRPTSSTSAQPCFSHLILVRSSSASPTYNFHLASSVGGRGVIQCN